MKYCIMICCFFICASAYAQPSADRIKSGYHLFNPTPEGQMRSFETDRPDATESPFTLDAGHFQYETDLIKSEREKTGGMTITHNFYNAANIKLGITNSLDLQFIAETFTTTVVKAAGMRSSTSGFGGLTIRAKKIFGVTMVERLLSGYCLLLIFLYMPPINCRAELFYHLPPHLPMNGISALKLKRIS